MSIFETVDGRLLEMLEAMRPIDDTFFNCIYDDNIEAMQELLEVIPGNEGICVVEVKAQKNIPNFLGRGVRFDVLAKDAKGEFFNIEVQRARGGASPKRVRFGQSAFDTAYLRQGEEVITLPKLKIIYITEFDLLKLGRPLYQVQKTYTGTDIVFDDGVDILFVNATCRDNTPLGKMMHDFMSAKAENMYNPRLRDRVDYLKKHEMGVRSMCEIMEKYGAEKVAEGRLEGRAEGRVEGRVEGRMEMLIANVKKLSANMSVEEAMDLLDVPGEMRITVLAGLSGLPR